MLGATGFNFKFIKAFGESLKEDIKRFLMDFHCNGIFPKGCNASFMSLIPKVEDPQGLGDYRPISLVGCITRFLLKYWLED